MSFTISWILLSKLLRLVHIIPEVAFESTCASQTNTFNIQSTEESDGFPTWYSSGLKFTFDFTVTDEEFINHS